MKQVIEIVNCSSEAIKAFRWPHSVPLASTQWSVPETNLISIARFAWMLPACFVMRSWYVKFPLSDSVFFSPLTTSEPRKVTFESQTPHETVSREKKRCCTDWWPLDNYYCITHVGDKEKLKGFTWPLMLYLTKAPPLSPRPTPCLSWSQVNDVAHGFFAEISRVAEQLRPKHSAEQKEQVWFMQYMGWKKEVHVGTTIFILKVKPTLACQGGWLPVGGTCPRNFILRGRTLTSGKKVI